MQQRALDNDRAFWIEKAKAKRELLLREERERQADLGSPGRLGGLIHFVRCFWHILEPSRPLVEGPALDAIILHLEAVTRGEIRRLLINVPPGFMKSMLVGVFWPAWEWSAAGLPEMRYVCFSYAAHLTVRDNGRFRDILRSKIFRDLWPELVLSEDGKIKIANDDMGWKFASAIKGVGTGERGDRIIWDDPHNVKEGESEAVRSETVRWGREGMPNRLNDMETGAIIIIMQRVHEEDVSGAILDDDVGYEHLMIPMYYDYSRQVDAITKEPVRTSIGWHDWRYSRDGSTDNALAWPERFSLATCKHLEKSMGPYAWTGQYQQTPEPRGGGIFRRNWWRIYKLHPENEENILKKRVGKPVYPPHFIVASLDGAFTNKDENDPSALSVWGLFKDEDTYTKVALLYAWEKRLDLHGERPPPKELNEKIPDYIERCKPHWGLIEWIAHTCRTTQVDVLLVENKANGLDVFSELRRLYRGEKWGVQLVDPGNLDKRNRAISIQHLFSEGLIFAPNRDWADKVITDFAKFKGLPGDNDHMVDTGTQVLRWMRDGHRILRVDEVIEEELEAQRYRPPLVPLYET